MQWENEISQRDFKLLTPLSGNENKDYRNDPAPTSCHLSFLCKINTQSNGFTC